MNHCENDAKRDRRQFLVASAGAAAGLIFARRSAADERRAELAADDRRALITISLDLEMSAQYPQRGMTEWNYEKGNLDDATKKYAVEAARTAKELGGLIHFFCVGRVLEQPDIDWLKQISAAGHPIGNHTYDHIYLLAKTPVEAQFRFQRAPWLVEGKNIEQLIRENIRLTTIALKERAGINVQGFRTPGGFADGLAGRTDLQQLLLEQGFKWVSSKYPRHDAGVSKNEPTESVYADIVAQQQAAQPFVYPSGLVEVPMSPISDVNAFRSNYWTRSWFLEAIRRSVEWAIDTGGTFDFLAHPSCLVVEDPHFEAISLICQLVKKAGSRAALVDLDTLAERGARNSALANPSAKQSEKNR